MWVYINTATTNTFHTPYLFADIKSIVQNLPVIHDFLMKHSDLLSKFILTNAPRVFQVLNFREGSRCQLSAVACAI